MYLVVVAVGCDWVHITCGGINFVDADNDAGVITDDVHGSRRGSSALPGSSPSDPSSI
jgi:hypothetical protein